MFVVFFPQFYSNHHPNTYVFSTKKGLPRQVRRKMNRSETEEILKEKSSNKRTENISSSTKKSSRELGCYREISGYLWPLKQILSESERVIRFSSSTIFKSLISFRCSYEKCFQTLNNLRLKPFVKFMTPLENWERYSV